MDPTIHEKNQPQLSSSLSVVPPAIGEAILDSITQENSATINVYTNSIYIYTHKDNYVDISFPYRYCLVIFSYGKSMFP